MRYLHTAVIIFACLLTVALAAPRAGAQTARLVKGQPETLLPANDEALAWRWNMRMTGWALSHSATGFEFNTPEQVERQVKSLKAQGYNTINEGSLFWNLAFTHRWEESIEMVKMICHYAHKHDMKVVHHMDGPVITYMGTGLQYLMEHPDWTQRDIRYSLPTFSHLCLNNPGFQDEFFGRLARFARETGVDGFMIDECTFAAKDYCGCPHCRRKFTQDTGCVLPTDPNSPVFFNYDDPLWVRWVRWRQRSLGDWRVTLRKRLNEANPNICIMTYTTHYGLYGNWASREFGSNLIQSARACDFIGTEIMSRNVFDAYRSVYAFRKIKAAIGDHFGGAIWGLVYHLDDPNIAYFGWALNQMNRQATWMSVIEGVDMQRYTEWPLQAQKDTARSVADTAILFSANSRDFAKRYSVFSEGHALSELMTDAHIQHDILLDEDVNRFALGRYKLLILPSVACMSGDQLAAVREYVRNGGALLVTGNTAFQNEDGMFRDAFPLADVAGVDIAPNDALIKGAHKVVLRKDERATAFPYAAFKATPRADAQVTVLADVVQNGRVMGPAVTINRYGKGACMYQASRLGLPNYETEHTAGKKWTFEMNRPLADLAIETIRLAAKDDFDVKAVAVPERVLLSVHRQPGQDGEQVLVHLLNATGAARLKKGDIVPSKKAEDSFPPIGDDIVFDLRLGDFASAVIVSPDYDGQRPVSLQKLTTGYTRVTVSKDDLKAYAIVYLTLR